MNDHLPELILLLSAAGAFLAWRWWTVWQTCRLRKSLGQALADAQKQPRTLDPESRFIIRMTDDGISCERPDGITEAVTWSGLQRVHILSTADGPLQPDQFWVLVGTDGGCVIPWGAAGDIELLRRLQQLPGFDNSAVIGSASRRQASLRTCWQRPEGS